MGGKPEVNLHRMVSGNYFSQQWLMMSAHLVGNQKADLFPSWPRTRLLSRFRARQPFFQALQLANKQRGHADSPLRLVGPEPDFPELSGALGKKATMPINAGFFAARAALSWDRDVSAKTQAHLRVLDQLPARCPEKTFARKPAFGHTITDI